MGKVLTAEFFGTFCLVFTGTGAIVINDFSNGAIGHVGIALTFGLIVMTMVYSLGDISGAHLNPAVTLGFWLAGRFPVGRVAPYIAAQFGGGIVASGFLFWMFPDHETLGATLPAISASGTLVFELLLTLILMMTILSVTTGAKEEGVTAALAVGGVVALEAMFAGPVTGASMNPARSLGPALVSGQLGDLWIYLVGPVVGAALAFPLCRFSRDAKCCPGCHSAPCESSTVK
jgi:aquaporin NIP